MFTRALTTGLLLINTSMASESMPRGGYPVRLLCDDGRVDTTSDQLERAPFFVVS